MNEVGMKSIGEGVSLNQLTQLYIKYKNAYHVVDFKYHLTASHNNHNYAPTRNCPSLFYMIENHHLYPIVNRQHQKSISHITDITHKKNFKPTIENHKNEPFIYVTAQMKSYLCSDITDQMDLTHLSWNHVKTTSSYDYANCCS